MQAEAELAHHLRRLAADGLPDLGAALTEEQAAAPSAGPEAGHRRDAATLAAEHFPLLTAGAVANRSYHGALPLASARISTLITTGVRAFPTATARATATADRALSWKRRASRPARPHRHQGRGDAHAAPRDISCADPSGDASGDLLPAVTAGLRATP
ncbi:hypothetical protein ACFVH6_32780 [Spirillospora sp. NPDC127200]